MELTALNQFAPTHANMEVNAMDLMLVTALELTTLVTSAKLLYVLHLVKMLVFALVSNDQFLLGTNIYYS
jgi:hypothetical protein